MSTVCDDKWEGVAWYWTISRLHYVVVCNEYILGICMCIFASHQCADYAYAGAGEAHVACVMFAVEAVWPHRAIVPNLHLYHHRMLSSAMNYFSRAYLNVSDCVRHIWPIPMVYNDIPHDIPECDPLRTYAPTYVLCENKSSIQSLLLMWSAIST